MTYNPHKIEKKWQEHWERDKTFAFSLPAQAGEQSDKPKYYTLDMFPYPSGDGLHVGHPEGQTATDIVAHYKRMTGYNVLHPMGWDAFGLPAENYAIKTGVHPAKTTKSSIDNFRRQEKALGFSYDWDREISTAHPGYYKWTQWLFLYLYKRDLAYQKEAPVNWCPSCQTVLANEQAVGGKCDRCGTEVVQKELKQWFFKTTEYKEELLKDLDNIDWPENIKVMQRNWIGKSEGATIKFEIRNSKLEIEVFTTRPDTLFGATYMVLAPEHQLVGQLISLSVNQEEIRDYVHEAGHKTELERVSAGGKDKTGVELKGVSAINPVNQEEIPVFVADYVLASYGTGAIMAVPAHDERDFAFATKYNLSIVEVIEASGKTPSVEELASKVYTGEGKLVNSGEFTGLSSKEARDKITKFAGGKKETQYRLRDWLISRQRYWGAPIPIIHCEDCGAVPVPEEDLPVLLTTDADFKPTGKSPLEDSREFHKVKCPKCSGSARRESDTMDTFVDSSWYYFRYIDPRNEKEAFNKEKIAKLMPVDLYVGGAEHAVLHLLYSRFVTKALRDGGWLKFGEPFLKLRNQGQIWAPDGKRMSKSRGNVVNPDEVLESVGADTFRLYEMFMGPFEDDIAWNANNIMGMFRFLTKVWNLGEKLESADPVKLSTNNHGASKEAKASKDLERLTHQTIKKVESDINNFGFNTAISALMVHLKGIEKENSSAAFRTFLLLLFPFAPHISAELWEKLDYGKYIWEESWPEVKKEYLVKDEISLIVQVNGKLRDTIALPTGTSKEKLEDAARKSEKVSRYLEEGKVSKVIVVPDKLVNFVTER